MIFIILEAFAIHYYANSTSYTKAKLITASNYVVGGIYSQISGLNSYLHLKKENAALTARVALLENELDGLRRDGSDPAVPPDSLLFTEDSVAGRRQFAYFPARVINNSIIRQENYITLNRGVEDGLQPDMAVVADRGHRGLRNELFGSFRRVYVGAEPRLQNERKDQRNRLFRIGFVGRRELRNTSC